MCLGTTGQVTAIPGGSEQIVTVSFETGEKDVSAAILHAQGEEVEVGDWVHVHMGFILEKTDEDHALESMAFQRALERGEFPTRP
ncbi:MAG: HypC/HybG/HupF family hydrogenase formation chaperone [Acidimicrobiia bacterium]